MITKILLMMSLLSCGIIGTISAQQPDTALFRLHYDFVHVNDTNNRDNPRKQEMVLYIGKYSSLYKSYISPNNDVALIRQLKNLGIAESDIKVKHSHTEELLINQTEASLTVIDFLNNTPYQLCDQLPAIAWQISEETADINGFMCQKAVGSFRGREYAVWFASDLPFSFGPWKLQGLPGLILQATDSRGDVLFHCTSVERTTDEPTLIAMPKNAVKTTLPAFERTKEAMQTNSTTMANANTNTTVSVVRMNSDGTAKQYKGDEAAEMLRKSAAISKQGNNNPLELKDN